MSNITYFQQIHHPKRYSDQFYNADIVKLHINQLDLPVELEKERLFFKALKLAKIQTRILKTSEVVTQ